MFKEVGGAGDGEQPASRAGALESAGSQRCTSGISSEGGGGIGGGRGIGVGDSRIAVDAGSTSAWQTTAHSTPEVYVQDITVEMNAWK